MALNICKFGVIYNVSQKFDVNLHAAFTFFSRNCSLAAMMTEESENYQRRICCSNSSFQRAIFFQ